MTSSMTMTSSSSSSKTSSFAQKILKSVTNFGFSVIIVSVLFFTFFSIRYQAPDPLSSPDKALLQLLSSVTTATFHGDDSILSTGEDFSSSSSSAISSAITLHSVQQALAQKHTSSSSSPSFACSADAPLNCSDPHLLLSIVAYNLLHFPDLAFFSYGSPVRGSAGHECDVSWKFRSRKEGSSRKYRDYRRFSLSVAIAEGSDFCNYTVVEAFGWHSGKNAKPTRKESSAAFGKKKKKPEPDFVLPSISSSSTSEELEVIDDAVALTVDPASFLNKKYLYYGRGGDRCKPMNHYLWSFLCALGEAIYLNRTMVVDLNLCLSAANNPGHERDEEGKDFRYYFDYAHLKEAASVVEQGRFLEEWRRWDEEHPREKAKVREVSDYRVKPMDLRGDESTVVMRKFEEKEPGNYWYRVCEGETEKVIGRPWEMVWKSKRLMDMATEICGRMEWDFDAIHVVRGKKAEEKAIWPNLEADTEAVAMVEKLKGKRFDRSRKLYIATEERDPEYFRIIKKEFENAFSLDDFADLWAVNSLWFNDTMALSGGAAHLPSSASAVEFDGYMRIEVDTEIALRAKRKFETFGFLTSDCKDGINTCSSSSSQTS